MLRKHAGTLLAPAAAIALAFAACSGKTTQAGGLEVVVATSGLTAGADFDTIELVVEQHAPTGQWNKLLDAPLKVGTEITLPATVSIQAGSSPDQDALIEVTAFKSGAARVQRVVQTQIPTNRIAELLMVLAWDCVGKVTACSNGSCQPDTGGCGSNVVDPSTLPNYVPGQSFDAGAAFGDSTVSTESGGPGNPGPDGAPGDAASPGDGGGPDATPTCPGGTGWRCAVDTSCAASTPTTLTGKVFDPAGANPLYNVWVFVPNVLSSLPAITPGTHTCGSCGASIGDYVVATATDPTGSFTLKGVPTGAIPVTVQIGKWRRTVTVDVPTSCATTALADGTLRLPKKRSEGDMPQMALLTGGCDDMGCFMTGMGIDPTEFTGPQGGGRLDIYEGTGLTGGGATLSNGTAGNCTGAGCPLWASTTSLEHYDVALLSCECAENANTKPAASMTAMRNWLDEGGKVFASHFQYTWFKNNPSADFQGAANWLGTSVANTSTVADDIVTTFPKGLAFSQWLQGVGALASAGPPPTLNLGFVSTSVSTVNSTAPQATLPWIYDPSTADGGSKGNVKYMSFGTPIGGMTPAPDAAASSKQYCGKAVFTDLHSSGSLLSSVSAIPGGCPSNAGHLTAAQKALEFLFFDLSSCVSDDSAPAPLPPGLTSSASDAGCVPSACPACTLGTVACSASGMCQCCTGTLCL